jgi:hypothetical protein
VSAGKDENSDRDRRDAQKLECTVATIGRDAQPTFDEIHATSES